jgi:hypothetical protein
VIAVKGIKIIVLCALFIFTMIGCANSDEAAVVSETGVTIISQPSEKTETTTEKTVLQTEKINETTEKVYEVSVETTSKVSEKAKEVPKKADPQPTKKPAEPKYDANLPDIALSDIAKGGGGKGPFTMELVSKTYQSDYWNLAYEDHPEVFKMAGNNIVGFAYRYEIFEAKGEKGGEEFRLGLAIAPVDYGVKNLKTEWQTFVLDLSNRNPTYIYQVGFEYGPDWTENKKGTIFYIDKIRFSNNLPEETYIPIDNSLNPPVLKK